jgi:acyl-CoA reductase-like NAD-dependent aldehyde dehydrogenase
MKDKRGKSTGSKKMLIGGKWVSAESGKTLSVLSPTTGEELGKVPLSAEADVDKAVKAAVEAFPVWSNIIQSERSRIIYKIANALKENMEELISLDVREHGTAIRTAREKIAGGIGVTEYAAAASATMMGQVLPQAIPNMISYLQRVPLGVCAVITPWNRPVSMMCGGIMPALAVGNTCVLKPASISSLQAVKFIEILDKVGLPPGTVNLVTGPGESVGEALASHPGVDVVRFTGSSETGKAIMAAASPTVKKVIMELGGNNPVIVCEDADVEKAATLHAQRHFGNCAQNCSTPGRYYVHEKVYDQFVDTFVNEVKKIVVGDPQDEKTTMGPMASRQQRDKVEYYIQSALKEGARIAIGGRRPTKPQLKKGYFLMPTVVADVTHNMTIAREETFGPVACILKFSSDEEALTLANDSRFGLCAGVWTKDAAKSLRLANALRTNNVFVNSPRLLAREFPWGGSVKESGIGKANGVCGMEEMTDLKLVCMSYA